MFFQADSKPFTTLLNAASQKRLISFSPLTINDLPEIRHFLNEVWTQYYGASGSPLFTDDYLNWLTSGPSKSKHLLFGGLWNNELVAYQAFLYRTVQCNGKKLNAYLNTHLAISPKLDLRLRMDCNLQAYEQSLLCDPTSPYHDAGCDLVFAFFEDTKKLKSMGDKFLSKYAGMERKTCSTFNQSVVMTGRLEKYLAGMSGESAICVRQAVRGDVPRLTALFNQVPDGPHFSVVMSEEELEHFFFGHPAHRTCVAERQDEISALINFYPLETIKAGKTSLYVVVEYLIADVAYEAHTACLAMLLSEAVHHARAIGAKAIVLENVSYLSHETCRLLGIAPTFRKMAMSYMAKDNAIAYSGAFRCDVK